MTAPTIRETLPVTYSVDGLTLGRHDEHGNWWIPQTTEGWHEPPAPRPKRENRPDGHGTSRGTSWRDARIIVIEGVVTCPDVTARLRARDTWNALMSDPGRLYEFVGTDQEGAVRTCMVELDAMPKFTLRNSERIADFQLTLAAPDPRKHDALWQDPAVNPVNPASMVDGLVFDEPGLDFSGAGLDFLSGTNPPKPGVAKVANHGSAPAHPVLKLIGPLPMPVITHMESGRVIRYAGNVAEGETVRINCGDFPARGLLEHECVSTVRGDVRSLVVAGMEWPVVAPREVASFQLTSPGATGAELMISLRSAWW